MLKLSNIREKVFAFINDNNEYRGLVLFAAGLYPFFQYYSNNISEATSWQQLLFIAGICIVLPQALKLIWNFVSKLNLFKAISPYGLSILNLVLFSGLIGFLVLNLSNKRLLLVLVVATVLGFLFAKFLKKVVVIQLILAVVSVVGLMPKLIFQMQQDNEVWAKLSQEELNTTFVETPNIFVIQPDGYVNFSETSEEPYNFDNSDFESWLISSDFTNYKNFRSNYYSTSTSNSSLFTMQHHYYSNTDKSTLKTHNSNDIIVGEDNNVLKVLKQNNYKTHLLTDNSFFLLDRVPLNYDFCNINRGQLSYHNSGMINGVDIQKDFDDVLNTIEKGSNFFFIEKTIPGHISYYQSYSKGKIEERELYFNRLRFANKWLKGLIKSINEFDENAMIIIIADHGGQVGMEYTLEVLERQLNEVEVRSTFSSMLSIKWPHNIQNSNLEFKSSVNVFRNVFFALSENKALIENKKKNASYLPLKSSGKTKYYKYIDDNGNSTFEEIKLNI